MYIFCTVLPQNPLLSRASRGRPLVVAGRVLRYIRKSPHLPAACSCIQSESSAADSPVSSQSAPLPLDCFPGPLPTSTRIKRTPPNPFVFFSSCPASNTRYISFPTFTSPKPPFSFSVRACHCFGLILFSEASSVEPCRRGSEGRIGK